MPGAPHTGSSHPGPFSAHTHTHTHTRCRSADTVIPNPS